MWGFYGSVHGKGWNSIHSYTWLSHHCILFPWVMLLIYWVKLSPSHYAYIPSYILVIVMKLWYEMTLWEIQEVIWKEDVTSRDMPRTEDEYRYEFELCSLRRGTCMDLYVPLGSRLSSEQRVCIGRTDMQYSLWYLHCHCTSFSLIVVWVIYCQHWLISLVSVTWVPLFR